MADLKKYNEEKDINSILKTLKLIQIAIDDSEKTCEAKIDSLLSKKKAEPIKYMIINEVSYVSDTAKKFDLTVPLNSTLLDLRKSLAKELNISWQ